MPKITSWQPAMSIFVIGINHKTAPLQVREKVYFAPEKLALYLQDLLGSGLAKEAVLLSTCNRSELYCSGHDIGAIRDWFCGQTTLPHAELASAIYIYRDVEAVAHIMQVACGLDSMILGEPQILGQMKAAFSESCAMNAVDACFHQLFQQVFSVAKEIRATTSIGACPVSLASTAVHFARQQTPSFDQAEIALIGAGETAVLLLRYLRKHLAAPLSLVTRNTLKVGELAEEFAVTVRGFDELTEVLASSDVVFSATASPSAIVTQDILRKALSLREEKPLLLIDIAVPRDIDPAVASLPQVSLFCIDDLKTVIEKNLLGREHAADKAHEMIRARSEAFIAEIYSIDKIAHTISAYRGVIEEICQTELLKAKHQLRKGEDPAKVLEGFAYIFTNKLLHTPSVQLRQAGVEGRFELLRFVRQLFAIPE